MATYSSMKATESVDLKPYPALTSWYERVKKEIPNYDEVDGKGAQEFGDYYKRMLNK